MICFEFSNQTKHISSFKLLSSLISFIINKYFEKPETEAKITKTGIVNQWMLRSQMRRQMLDPDLYVLTLKLHSNFSLYKKDKNMKKKIFALENIKKTALKSCS